MTETPPLTFFEKLAYAAPGFALSAVGVPLFIYVPKFYVDVIGLDVGLLGWIILAAQLIDGLVDPVIGRLSDRTRGPYGRRRPWILLGSLLSAGLLYLLYTPPTSAGPEGLTGAAVRFAVLILLLTATWSATNVPWESLAPELATEYHARTGLFALRDGLVIAGVIAAAAAPGVVKAVLGLPPGPEAERQTFLWYATIYAPLVAACGGWCFLTVRERPVRAPRTSDENRPGFFQALAQTGKNRPFVRLLLAYVIAGFGANIPATLIVFYVTLVLGAPGAEPYLAAYLLTGVACLPAWAWIAKRVGKKAAWLGSMLVNAGAFLFVFFLGRGDTAAYGALVVLSGTGFGASLALPSAMQADVIDLDELTSGERREGLYMGSWSVAKKLASAVGLGVALPALDAAGYRPGAEVQPESVIFALRVLYALVPSLCCLAAVAVAWGYPLDQAAHARVRAELARKRAEKPSEPGEANGRRV